MNQPDPRQRPQGSAPQHAKVTPPEEQKNEIAQFVTAIKNPEQQVGEHIIRALQHDNTVAVITTVGVGSDGQQRVISAALDARRMEQVQEILSAAEEERKIEEPCIGFHCLIEPKEESTS